MAGGSTAKGTPYFVYRRISGKPKCGACITEVFQTEPDMSQIGCTGE